MTPGPEVDLGIQGVTEATLIGRGEFGTVYRARQNVLDRTVAVKVLHDAVPDEETRRRYQQECRSVAALSSHPNVVAVYDWGHTPSGQPYLVQEYMPGGTLAGRIAEFGALPWEDVAETGVKLAGALAAAHRAGILHGDLKPENVLVSSFDEPELTDFAVARMQGGLRTPPPTVTPTLAHAAPEVLSGQAPTEASDVYSLASTLYALAAGHAPFVRTGDEPYDAVRGRVASETPPDLRPSVPGPLWDALAAALAKDPANRTSSARAFGEALRAAQESEGVAPTRLVVPEPAAVPAAAAAATAATATAAKGAAAARPARLDHNPVVRPVWIVALAVALFALLGGAALALTTWEDDDDQAQPAVTTTTPPAPTTIALLTTTTSPATTLPPTTVPAPTTTRPASPGTTAAPTTTTRPAPGIPACTPAFFRATVTSDRATYRNGETVQVVARFENISGRPCSYTSTGATSQVLKPSGEALTPVRTLPGNNDDNVPFEPGTAQTFASFWNVSICSPPGTCSPGRYSMVVDVVPFGGGRVSFDVTGP